MRFMLALFGIALLLSDGRAMAQTIILGGGSSVECYQEINSPFSNPSRAERLCNKALNEEVLDTRNRAATLVNRGIARMRQGDADLALEDFERAGRLIPNLPDLKINQGAVLVYMKRYADAISLLQTAVMDESDNLHIAYLNLGLAREGLGDVEGAYFDIARARELAPDWSVAEREFERFEIKAEGL